MTFEYANRWFRVEFEFYPLRPRPVLRKYAIVGADASRAVKQTIVRSISAQLREEPRRMR